LNPTDKDKTSAPAYFVVVSDGLGDYSIRIVHQQEDKQETVAVVTNGSVTLAERIRDLLNRDCQDGTVSKDDPSEQCASSPTGLHDWRKKNNRTFGQALPAPWLVCNHCQAWRDITATPAPQRTADNF
jgi:hypothetical protein